jgi:ABC-type Mn2+/Zn2+ transport system ATPase subunit
MSAPAEAPVLLRTSGLGLAWDGVPVLGDVDMVVHSGEFWALAGPNGAGKSTFLQAVLGTVPAAAGGIRRHPRLAAQEHIGFVPQRGDMAATLPTTVREFVLLGLVGTRTGRGERPARLAWALAHAGLAGLGAHDLWTLSGGQRQRALVARALVRRPSLLLLDEPTTHLDHASEERLLELLMHLNRADGLTILMVTHDVAALLPGVSHVALFGDGGVRAGSVAAMATQLGVHGAEGTS